MNDAAILLVDDDRQVLDSMSAWLREQGYAVQTAASCARASSRSIDRRSTWCWRIFGFETGMDLIFCSTVAGQGLRHP